MRGYHNTSLHTYRIDVHMADGRVHSFTVMRHWPASALGWLRSEHPALHEECSWINVTEI